ncbi:DUF86 domain-containing protein [Marinilongibacter aquaticus]|uniref:HepT-like ribonuclease domain-containing protein n=1 Tax=Marinilongibacter aquaticus TaxID=2975157 RepID=UPI0021BDDBC3|nr:HepT-like ribonuclease domain-containing protein [Marinilongibacter aquaticus]UBM59620.1 DUF86 domain-containing protein [Marinilongibacter aquaticus]
MDIKIMTWLTDIDQCIDEITDFLPERKDFFEYKSDLKTKKAVERNIEIIGEAVKRILNKDPGFPIKNARRIVDTRNRIIHGYDSISDEIIWGIVINELPNLKLEVSELLGK